MENWRKCWREGFVPEIGTKGLLELKKALETDDARLIQRATTSPPPLNGVMDWPVEAACALGYCGWMEMEADLNAEQDSVKPDDAVEIKLTRDKVAWVSPDDYDTLSKFSWWALEHHGRWYAYRKEYVGGEGYQQHNVQMHRQIMAAPEGVTVDHKDRNGLNNHRSNLRLLTDAQNKQNCKRTGQSVFRGVYPSPTGGKWCAKISMSGKSVYLGTFVTEHDAANAYNKAATEHFGPNAALNKFVTVAEVDKFFAQHCFKADERLGEPAACRYWLNWFDDTPRDEVRAELLVEVSLALKNRE